VAEHENEIPDRIQDYARRLEVCAIKLGRTKVYRQNGYALTTQSGRLTAGNHRKREWMMSYGFTNTPFYEDHPRRLVSTGRFDSGN
jgi:hypothetical protein